MPLRRCNQACMWLEKRYQSSRACNRADLCASVVGLSTLKNPHQVATLLGLKVLPAHRQWLMYI